MANTLMMWHSPLATSKHVKLQMEAPVDKPLYNTSRVFDSVSFRCLGHLWDFGKL